MPHDLGLDRDDARVAARLLATATAANDAHLAGAASDARRLRSAFVSAVSHEFRTPITVVTAAIELIATGQASGDDAQRLAIAAQRQLGRLERLVGSVLVAAGADGDQREEVLAVDRLGDFVLDRLRDDEQGRVVLDLPATEALVTVGARLGSALGLLVEQAVRRAGEDEEVHVSVRRRPEGVDFVVNDLVAAPVEPGAPTGRCGAVPDDLDPDVVGTEVGLFTSDQIARRLGGGLRVEADGVGLAASLFVPQRRETDLPGAQRARAAT